MTDRPKREIRWKPAAVIIALTALALLAARLRSSWAHEQERIVVHLVIAIAGAIALFVWWLFGSRVQWKTRLIVLAVVLLPLGLFRIRGMTGDFVPIVEFRFAPKKAVVERMDAPVESKVPRTDFPQLLGPNRDARLSGPKLASDWATNAPQLIWRQPIGAAWSGFAIVNGRAVTQEQDGEEECVTCYEVNTGALLWKTKNPGRYSTSIAGTGPRSTPTIVDGRVFTLGALGLLQCLDLETGKVLWARDIKADAGTGVPEWGFASSPLVHDGMVLVNAGGSRSLIAYQVSDGQIAWGAGERPVSYGSPTLLNLAGRLQVLAFNSKYITAHDPATGEILWEYGWGKGNPQVSRPIPVSENGVIFSSGYGVGSTLLEIAPDADGKLRATQKWKTVRFQAKFSNPVEQNGHVYGVSDGIFACLEVDTGKVKWKDGRYGHGQGLWIGDHYLQMREDPGELILLQPTPEAANELARFPVFAAKTWNPIALTGDLLLVRNDQEAACIRLPVQ